MKNSFHSVFAVALVFVSGFVSFSFAQAVPEQNSSAVKIKNFGQMDERFFRGAQPKKDDYQALAAVGVKTIVDLRDDPEEYEKPLAEAAGIKYVNIPMSDTKYPKPENIEAFLNLINDPTTGVFYVHCAGGRHRTGVIGAVYRFNKYGWDFDRVYKEMKQYDFYTRWGHGAMKDFVVDYAAKFKNDSSPVTVAKHEVN